MIVKVEQGHYVKVAQRHSHGYGEDTVQVIHGAADQPVSYLQAFDLVHQQTAGGRRTVTHVILRVCGPKRLPRHESAALVRRRRAAVTVASVDRDLLADRFHLSVDPTEFLKRDERKRDESQLDQAQHEVVRVHAHEIHHDPQLAVVVVEPDQPERVHGQHDRHARKRHRCVERDALAALRSARGRVRVVRRHLLVVCRHCRRVFRPRDDRRHETRDAQRSGVHAGHRAQFDAIATAVEQALQVRCQDEIEKA